MALSIHDQLADKGVHPSAEHLSRIEVKWEEIRSLKGDFDGLNLDDADIAVRNTAGGDHLV